MPAPGAVDSLRAVGLRWYLGVGRAVLGHPALWPTALGQLWRLRRSDWWQRPPFLPLPGAGYLRFRMVTAYGEPTRSPDPADVVRYLEWCRRWPGAD